MQRIQTTVQPGWPEKRASSAESFSVSSSLTCFRPRRDCPVRLTGCCWLLKRWCAKSKMTQTQSWPFDIKDINENKCECAFGCLGLFLSSRNERARALLACLSVIFWSVADDLRVSLHLLLSPAGCRALAEVSAEGCWDRGGPDPGEERRSGGTASTGMTARGRNVKMSQHKTWTPQGWDSILVCCQENRNNSVPTSGGILVFLHQDHASLCCSATRVGYVSVDSDCQQNSDGTVQQSPPQIATSMLKRTVVGLVTPAESHTGWSLCLIC